jgi:hypothetical protein
LVSHSRRAASALVYAALALALLHAKNGQNVLPLSSPLYGLMDSLYLATGQGSPSASRPWSVAEARLLLSRLDREELQGALAAAYDSIARNLEEAEPIERGNAQFDIDANLAFEAYAQSGSAPASLENEWLYGYEERKPLAKLALEIGFLDNLYLYSELEYGRGRFSAKDEIAADPSPYNVGTAVLPADSLWVTGSYHYGAALDTNLLELVDVNFECPRRAFVSFGDEWWNLQLGRDKASWGKGHSGNLVIGDQLDHHDYLRFTAFGEALKLESMTMFLTHPAFTAQSEDYNKGVKIFLAHRLELRPLPWIGLAISENVMYQDDALDPIYFNPAYVYHNLNNRAHFNAIASAEAELCPLPGLELYAQFALDQARAPLESDIQKAAWGVLGGLEYSGALGPGLLDASLEFALTTPYLYRRDIVDFLVLERYFTVDAGGGFILHGDYLGYRYGGDALTLRADLAFTIPEACKLSFYAIGLRHGAVGLNGPPSTSMEYPNRDATFLSGPRIAESLVLGLKASSMRLRVAGGLGTELWAELDYIGKRDYVKAVGAAAAYYEAKGWNLQFSAGLSLSL